MVRVDGEELGGAQCRERHRPRPCTDRSCAARSNWMTANWRTKPTSLWAAAVPSPQMHRPQQSSVDGSSVQRPVLSIRLRQAPVSACASFKNRTRNTGETVQRPLRVGLSGGDNEHPGHVVGAVAVLGRGSARQACSKVPRRSVSRSRWSKSGAGVVSGHATARPLSEMRWPDPDTPRPRPARPARRQPAGLGGHRAGEARLGQDPAQGGRQRVRVVVVDDDARAAAQGARRRAGRRWRRPVGRPRWHRPEHRR